MPINFPDSPSANQTFVSGDYTWSYNATSNTWESIGVALDNSSDTQVLFNDGGVANGSSNLVFIKSTGNVGIGTTSPSAKLDIASGSEGQTSPVDAIIIRGPNVPANSISSQNLTWKFAGAGSAIISAHRGGAWDTYLQFSTNPASPGGDSPQVGMHIAHSGNVGIGTTSPANKLEVYGNTPGEGITITNSNEPAAYKWKFSTVYDSSSPYRMYTVNDQILLAAGRLGDKVVFPSGNIGIGDGWLDANVPAAKLHVNGTSNITSTALFGNGVEITNPPSSNIALIIKDEISPATYYTTLTSGSASGRTANLTSVNSDLNLNAGSRLALLPVGGGWSLPITLSTQTNMTYADSFGTSFTTLLGTFAPVSGNGQYIHLDLIPTINQDVANCFGDYTLIKGYATETAANGANNKLIDLGIGSTRKFSVSNTGVMYVSGNVGIGTSSPDKPLEVAPPPGASNSTIRLQSNGVDKAYWTDFIQPYPGDFHIAIKTNGYPLSNVFVATPGATPVTLLPHGNVGIGTTSPVAKLEVAGKLVVSDGDGTEVTGGSSALQIVGGYSSPVAGRFIFGDGTGWQTHFSKYASSTLTDLFSFYDNGEFYLDGLNSGIIRLRNSPSVANTLDLHIRPDSGNSGYITFTEDAVADRWAVGVANGDSSLLFKSGYLNGTERMRIESSGNVGIGTTSPAYKLHVDGTINASSVLVNGSPIGGSSGAKIVLKPEAASFPTSNPAQYKAVSGTNFPVESLAFDATTEESCYFKFDAINYSSGSLTVTFNWYADTATSGGVVWEAALAAITPNSDTQDIETKAFATAQNVSDSHIGTTGQRLHSVDLTLSNTDSIAENDYCVLRISRKPVDASDTMTGDALLTGIRVSYS